MFNLAIMKYVCPRTKVRFVSRDFAIFLYFFGNLSISRLNPPFHARQNDTQHSMFVIDRNLVLVQIILKTHVWHRCKFSIEKTCLTGSGGLSELLFGVFGLNCDIFGLKCDQNRCFCCLRSSDRLTSASTQGFQRENRSGGLQGAIDADICSFYE